jgi:hypothetical protein
VGGDTDISDAFQWKGAGHEGGLRWGRQKVGVTLQSDAVRGREKLGRSGEDPVLVRDGHGPDADQ